jgi:C1A family cysteine protease
MLVIFLTLFTPVNASEFVKAPLNPAFLQLPATRGADPSWNGTPVPDGEEAVLNPHGLGFSPGPIDFSHLVGESIVKGTVSLPRTYDLRREGRVSPVRNQGSAGSCWVFATYGSLESSLLPNESWDFSENHVKNTLSSAYTWGFDRVAQGGGDAAQTAAYLGRWSGPVSETDDPYVDVSTRSPEVLPVQQRLTQWKIIPPRSNALDNDEIKFAIMTIGGVFSAFEWEDGRPGDYGDYYNPKEYAYYYSGPFKGDHGITLIGWDDDFPSDAFTLNGTPNPAPGDGAYIVKNSWGTGFGDKGYFYISYYDTTMGRAMNGTDKNPPWWFPNNNNAVYQSVPLSEYDNIYQYDQLGWVDSLGTGSQDFLWGANLFTAGGEETLTAVGIYTPQVHSRYNISVYLSPDSGPINTREGPVLVQEGIIPYPGYHVIQLSRPVQLSDGEVFSVVVREQTPGYNYPLPVEYALEGYSSHAEASGKSFGSSDGIVWRDIRVGSGDTTMDACIKAFTNNNVVNPVPGIYWTTPSEAVAGGEAFTLRVIGENFMPGCTIRWNGQDRDTKRNYVSSLEAVIPAEDIATPGVARITVFNPAPVGGESEPVNFPILKEPHPVPQLLSTSPSRVPAGSPGFTLILKGTGFTPVSVVRWNGTARTTTYISPEEVSAVVPSSDISLPGTATVTVYNPPPGGGVSTGIPLSIFSSPAGKPVAEFTANPKQGPCSLTVAFIDQSTGAPVSWFWNFGDGTSSTLRAPYHTYTKPGKYSVSLKVSNAYGSYRKVRTGYITVNAL